jgi:plastocyanin
MAAALLLVVGAGACSSKSSTSSTTTTSGGASSSTAAGGSTATSGASSPGTVTIKSFTFSPNPAHAKVGDTITVNNTDPTAHTFTADDGSFDTKPIDAGGMATVKLTKAGTIAYHCNIHQSMHGTIIVSA